MTLITFERYTEHQLTGADAAQVHGAPIAISPDHVAVVFEASRQGATIIRLSDGRGFIVAASFGDVQRHMPHLVLMERYVRPSEPDSYGNGEDDGMDSAPPEEPASSVPIAFGAAHIAAVFGSQRTLDMTVVRLADGRGFAVKGTFAEAMQRLGMDALAAEETVNAQALVQ